MDYKFFSYSEPGDHLEAELLTDEINVVALESLYQYHLLPEYHYRGEIHDLYEFFYVINGNMVVSTGEGKTAKDFNLSAGEYIIVPPNIMHAMNPDKCHSLSVAITFACNGLNDKLITLKKSKISDEQVQTINMLVKNYADNFYQKGYKDIPIKNPMKNEYAFRQLMKNELETLLILTTRMFLESDSKETNDNKSATLAESVKKYVDEHFKENIKLEDIAQSLGYCVGHVCHQFKKNYSMSIINYMLRRRIIEALVMFESSDVSIQQVSDELGFDSAQYFSYIFKRFTHITPRQYQTRIRKTHIINPEYIISNAEF